MMGQPYQRPKQAPNYSPQFEYLMAQAKNGNIPPIPANMTNQINFNAKGLDSKGKGSGQTEMKEGENQDKNNKLFKRQSYHVGIAYYIHYKKVSEGTNGVLNETDYDPTFHAKKLREGQGMPE